MTASWRRRAACRGIDAEVFYPATEDEADAAPAKAICGQCPVREPCLEHALGHRDARASGGAPRNASAGASCASDASPPEPAVAGGGVDG